VEGLNTWGNVACLAFVSASLSDISTGIGDLRSGGGIALSQDVRVGRLFFGGAILGEFVRQPFGWSWCEDPSPGPIRGNRMKTIDFITTLVALSQGRGVRQAMLPSSGRRAWLPQRAVNEWFK
jgi:hypothetical protein